MRRYSKRIVEDDSQEAQQPQQNDNSGAIVYTQKLAQMSAEIDRLNAERETKKRQIDTDTDNKVTGVKKQMQLLRQEAAGKGFDLTGTSESSISEYRYSNRLFESVPEKKTAEMFAVLKVTQDNLEDRLSYIMPDVKCTTYAKRLVEFINSKRDEWENDGASHWDDGTENCVKFKLTSLLERGTGSFSDRELNMFVNEFGKVLRSNPVFSWIFGRE